MITKAAVKGLEADVERELAIAYRDRQDPEALRQLVESHIGLVYRIVHDYYRAGKAEFEELVSAGKEGLVIAAQRFDPDRGTRLSTYAIFWIRAYVIDATMLSQGVCRIGRTQSSKKVLWHSVRAVQKIEAEGRIADAKAIAEELGVGEETVSRTLAAVNSANISFDCADATARGKRLMDQVSFDSEATDPETMFAEQEERTDRFLQLAAALRALPARERKILLEHFSDESKTFVELGRELGVSRERVRQLALRALETMQENCYRR